MSILAGFFFILCANWWWGCIPQPLFSTPYSKVLFDRNDRLLEARLATDEQWRFPPISELPENYISALIEFEDRKFQSHMGIDLTALMRALVQNLSSGHIVSGGSTITMQLVRMANGNPNRTYTQKLIEVFQALRLETKYTKKEILNLYASHAPFGGNIVGLTAASWRYFGRSPAQLSWAESALLAVLPNNPANIRPGYHQKYLKAKRNRLLKKLHASHKISELDFQLAVVEPLPEKALTFPKLAPHLLESLSYQPEKFRINPSKKGLLNSTLNSRIQGQIETIKHKHWNKLKASHINHLAALVVDNESGQVVAYVGNSNFDFQQGSGYAMDLIHRPRSTGSILKPFLYGAMLEEGLITPKQLVPDIPVNYDGYRPENYDLAYRGVVPAKQALAQSLNIPAVNMLQEYGISLFYDFLEDAGVTSFFRQAEAYGLPLILGGAEGNLWEMTQLYSQLSQIAQNTEPKAIQILKGITPNKIKGLKLSSGSAWLTLTALLEVNRPGSQGNWKKYSSSRKVAWKTGTSYGFRDAWAIGTTPKYTVGVWVGNAEGKGAASLVGTRAAAPLMFDIFNTLPSTGWYQKPGFDLKKILTCRQDGFLANRYCEHEQTEIPANSNYSRLTPYHERIHTDLLFNYQVSTACESLKNIKSSNWFSLPPHLAHYYQKTNSDYLTKPKWRQDCLNLLSVKSPISFIYPRPNTKVYIPKKLDGKRSVIISEVAHNHTTTRLYWYIDNEYLGVTSEIHQMEMAPLAGKHEILVLDQDGNQAAISIEVLGQN